MSSQLPQSLVADLSGANPRNVVVWIFHDTSYAKRLLFNKQVIKAVVFNWGEIYKFSCQNESYIFLLFVNIQLGTFLIVVNFALLGNLCPCLGPTSPTSSYDPSAGHLTCLFWCRFCGCVRIVLLYFDMNSFYVDIILFTY